MKDLEVEFYSFGFADLFNFLQYSWSMCHKKIKKIKEKLPHNFHVDEIKTIHNTQKLSVQVLIPRKSALGQILLGKSIPYELIGTLICLSITQLRQTRSFMRVSGGCHQGGGEG